MKWWEWIIAAVLGALVLVTLIGSAASIVYRRECNAIGGVAVDNQCIKVETLQVRP